jgi:hypothetical protein
MKQNSPNIAPRRALFARPSQALPISQTSKTQHFCTRCLGPLPSMPISTHTNQTTCAPHARKPRKQNSAALGIQRVSPNSPRNRRAKLPRCLRLRPVFQHGLPTIQATVATSPHLPYEKRREIQPHHLRFSPPSRAGTVFASPPQIAEWTVRIKSAMDSAEGRLPSETTGHNLHFYAGPNPAIGPVL